MKRVLLRADAHPAIGIGDLMSLIHLAVYFTRSGWQPHLMIRAYPAALALVSRYRPANLHVLGADAGLDAEVAAINALVDQLGIDLVFFEITARPLTDYTGLRPAVAKACVCFDGKIPAGLDLVVDWDVAAASFFHPEDHPATRFLLGPRYVILPPDFDARAIAGRRHRSAPATVLVCMGGADEHNFTHQVCEAVMAGAPNLQLHVVVGAGYPYLDGLKAVLKAGGSAHRLDHNIDTMFAAYMGCDVAVGAGGLTASELVATRTPAVLIATYDHQVARCRYFDEQGWARYLGCRRVDSPQLIDAILHPPTPADEPLFDTGAIVRACERIVS